MIQPNGGRQNTRNTLQFHVIQRNINTKFNLKITIELSQQERYTVNIVSYGIPLYFQYTQICLKLQQIGLEVFFLN